LAGYWQSKALRAVGRAFVPAAWTYATVLGFFASYGSAVVGGGFVPFAISAAATLVVGFVCYSRAFLGVANAEFGPKLRTSAAVVVLAVATTGIWTSGRDRDAFVEDAIAGLASGSTGQSSNRPNILLVTVDTLRADHLGPYGYTAIRTPGIDALASRGIVFEQMIAQSSWTRSSFGSMWTSRSPSFHGANWRLVLGDGVGRNDTVFSDGLRPDLPTLAQLLRDAGYKTAGINTNIQPAAMFGFDKGFDHYVDYSRPLSLLEHTLLCKGLKAHREDACDDVTS
jgi:hypothetical protein